MHKMFLIVETYDDARIPSIHSDASRALARIARLYMQAKEDREAGYESKLTGLRLEEIEFSGKWHTD